MTDFKYLKRAKNEEKNGFPAEIFQLRTDNIRPNRAQPRADFDNNAIIRLADSIRRYGILQPLTVRRSEDDELYDYELIAGERRLRAAKMLGYFTVPCIILQADEQMSAEMAIIENLLREELNMFEQAYGFRKLIENHALTQEEVARRMSMSQSAVANKLRLLKLSYEEQKVVLETGLTERHARAVLRIMDEAMRLETLRQAAAEKWNVQQTEEFVESLLEEGRRLHRAVTAKSATAGRDAEGEAEALVKGLQKTLDRLKKEGKNVTVNVLRNAQSVDIAIRIAR